MENVIITGFSNPTSEGIVLHLNKKASLKLKEQAQNELNAELDKINQL